MDLAPDVVASYVEDALRKQLAVADRLGDELVNRRPHGDTTNAVAALTIHSCLVVEFWLGHVALGHPTDRDRESEFDATATVAELHEVVEQTIDAAAAHLTALEAGGMLDHGLGGILPGGGSEASLVLHVLEELYQHLGHAELTADALLA